MSKRNFAPEKVWTTRTGLTAAIGMNRLGVYVGYVAVQPGHPLYGLSHTSESPHLQFFVKRLLSQPISETTRERLGMSFMIDILSGNVRPRLDTVIRVHGGLTFSSDVAGGDYPIETKDSWWFGFDCGHAGDFVPAIACGEGDASLRKLLGDEVADKLKAITDELGPEETTYREAEYAEQECEYLSEQLVEIANHVAKFEKGDADNIEAQEPRP